MRKSHHARKVFQRAEIASAKALRQEEFVPGQAGVSGAGGARRTEAWVLEVAKSLGL
jgi:hypothetical protein